MTDEYNVARYIPKKYQKDIDAIEIELDFDNGTYRTVHRYYVDFNNGDRISAIGIKGIVEKIKQRSADTKKDCIDCLYAEETDGSHCYECVKGKSKYEPQERSGEK